MNRARNWSGLFAGLAGDAEVVALGLPDARVQGGDGSAGALAGQNNGHVGAVWASGQVSGTSTVGGLVGANASGTVVASYSTAAVSCAGTTGAGLVGARTGTGGSIAASYSTGRVTGASCATKAGLATGSLGTVTASYWDTGLSQIADDGDSNAPEGKATADLQAPTDYDSLVGNPGEAVYATWDDQDVDGDGATGDGDDADPWDFGAFEPAPDPEVPGLGGGAAAGRAAGHGARVRQLDAGGDDVPGRRRHPIVPAAGGDGRQRRLRLHADRSAGGPVAGPAELRDRAHGVRDADGGDDHDGDGDGG